MAAFCIECWNKLNNINYSKRKYVMSREKELCEGCGEYKSVIIRKRSEFFDFLHNI